MSFTNSNSGLAKSKSPAATQDAAEEFKQILRNAVTRFQKMGESIGMPPEMIKETPFSFRLSGLDGDYNFKDAEGKDHKFSKAAVLSHKGQSAGEQSFNTTCLGSDAFAELLFGLFITAIEFELQSVKVDNLYYSVFVERSNTNWGAIKSDLSKLGVQKNTYSVYKAYLTPKVGPRGMSPAVLYKCKSETQTQTQTQTKTTKNANSWSNNNGNGGFGGGGNSERPGF